MYHLLSQFLLILHYNRAVNTSQDGRGISGPGSVKAPPPSELKEAKAKLVNVQFDLKEKDVKISILLNQIQTLQKEKEREKENILNLSNKIDKIDFSPDSVINNNGDNSDSNNSNNNNDNNDIAANATATALLNQKKIEKYEDDLKNIRIDVDKLQVEKKEAEDAGKSFMDR